MFLSLIEFHDMAIALIEVERPAEKRRPFVSRPPFAPAICAVQRYDLQRIAVVDVT
jgi:hypothetical protein